MSSFDQGLHVKILILYSTQRVFALYYKACVCGGDNTCSDWLIQENFSLVMPRGRLRAGKAKSHVTNNLLTSNVRSFEIFWSPLNFIKRE